MPSYPAVADKRLHWGFARRVVLGDGAVESSAFVANDEGTGKTVVATKEVEQRSVNHVSSGLDVCRERTDRSREVAHHSAVQRCDYRRAVVELSVGVAEVDGWVLVGVETRKVTRRYREVDSAADIVDGNY